MDKYRNGLNKHTRPEQKKLPISEGQEALVKAKFASQEKELFFNDAYADILSDLFMAWLNTKHHEKETREYLYATAMALGSVKEKLISIETFGKNVPYIEKHTPQLFKDTTEEDDVAQQRGEPEQGEV